MVVGRVSTECRHGTLRACATECGTTEKYRQKRSGSNRSDFQPRPPPACTVLSFASRSAGRSASLLPRRRFLRHPVQCFETRRSLFFLSSVEPVARNGLLLASNGCPLSKASIPGSKLLACYFASCLSASLSVRPFGSITFAGSPRSQATSLPQARFSSASRLDWPLPLPPLPFRTFTSFQIKAFSRIRCPSARLPTTPDFLSLPDAGSISRVGLGSPFLDRYVSGD